MRASRKALVGVVLTIGAGCGRSTLDRAPARDRTDIGPTRADVARSDAADDSTRDARMTVFDASQADAVSEVGPLDAADGSAPHDRDADAPDAAWSALEDAWEEGHLDVPSDGSAGDPDGSADAWLDAALDVAFDGAPNEDAGSTGCPPADRTPCPLAPAAYAGRVALTFDDGPRPGTTDAVLDILRRERVPATFFVLGWRLEYEDSRVILRDIVSDPLFGVGNHSVDHRNFRTLSDTEIGWEVDTTDERIASALGDPCGAPALFRFPYGAGGARERALVEGLDHCIADVIVDPVDWCFADGEGTCPESVAPWVPEGFRSDMVGYLLDRLAATDGGIVLMHDIHPNTVAHLPEMLRRMRAAGYRFVSLREIPSGLP